MNTFSDFLLLRHELLIVGVLLVLWFWDIFASDSGKRNMPIAAYVLFAALTVVGFVAAPTGTAFGGLYVCTPAALMVKNILNIGTLLVLLQSHAWLTNPATANKKGEFLSILLTTLLGMYIMVSAGNFMMLYIGIEMASLPMACLAAFDKYRMKSAEAGVKYILTAAFSSAVLLLGVSYLYATSGTLYFDVAVSAAYVRPLTLLGLVFFISGLAFKISLVPFHLWTADVYEGAPTSVTAYLSVVSKGAGVFALMFTLWKVFGSFDEWKYVLWALAAVTITVGNLFAIRQKDIKRFFAFSSISQAGYIAMGIMSGTAQGMTATMYFLLIYIVSNLAAFGVIAAVENGSNGRTEIAAYNGLYHTNPLLSFVMMLAVFSLAGIPVFAGFFSKFFIFSAAAERGHYVLLFIALVNTVVALYYYLLIVRAMFIEPRGELSVARVRICKYNRLSLVLCLVGIVALGIVSAVYGYLGEVSWGAQEAVTR
jgi:NADH-quinone oxidoreductase subunit N